MLNQCNINFFDNLYLKKVSPKIAEEEKVVLLRHLLNLQQHQAFYLLDRRSFQIRNKQSRLHLWIWKSVILFLPQISKEILFDHLPTPSVQILNRMFFSQLRNMCLPRQNYSLIDYRLTKLQKSAHKLKILRDKNSVNSHSRKFLFVFFQMHYQINYWIFCLAILKNLQD